MPPQSHEPDTRPVHPRATALADIASWVSAAAGPAGRTVVTGITLSSLRVRPGDLYAALPGARAHGVRYADDALAAGAVAVLTDPAGAAELPGDVPRIVVEDPRRVLGAVSAAVYGRPAETMAMIGVTGTQGKTTTTRLAEGAMAAAGTRAAVVGTVGTRIAGREVRTSLTTPEAPDLHALFAVMREQEVSACAMEVSSHALVKGRVDGVVFDVAAFLNLGRDHLDFHTDLEDYYRAKASLFAPDRARLALVDLDDEHGRRLAEEVASAGAVPLRTMSSRGRDADWRATDVALGREGSRFVVHGPGGLRVAAGVPLPGGFNVANALAAIAAAGEAGLDAEAVAGAMASAGGVPGRLERVETDQDFLVVVDYAHKPDAVEAALGALRPVAGSTRVGGGPAGRLIVVIGAGGDRDPGKRPLMGGIAARLADLVVVTDDNPRTESPAAIRAAVLDGVAAGDRAKVVEVGDRGEAIRHAVATARPGDVVLVAGKGHEAGQEVDGVVHEFDDRVVVRRALEALADPAARGSAG